MLYEVITQGIITGISNLNKPFKCPVSRYEISKINYAFKLCHIILSNSVVSYRAKNFNIINMKML